MNSRFAGPARTLLLALATAVLAGISPACPQDRTIEPLSSFSRSALMIEAGGARHRFEVWLADSPPRRAQGLMFVEKLAPGTGMLFVYGEPRPISMWMKNTLIALDMLFIAADGRVTRIARNTEPQSLATISSLGPVTGVLEIGGGESGRLGIDVGDRVLHQAFR